MLRADTWEGPVMPCVRPSCHRKSGVFSGYDIFPSSAESHTPLADLLSSMNGWGVRSPMPDRSKESSQTKRTPSPVLTPPPSPIPFPHTYLPTPPPPLPPAQGALIGEFGSRRPEPDSPPITLLTLILTFPLVLRDRPSWPSGAFPGTDAIRFAEG
ncbi:hypothetical protein ABEB36_009413 [Hypothenemus hampei]|uniref:Uncharacterized protein n=1 Tax=Hypothenemus hampei TaxID=57062 RepID=A0ABD1EGA8_HYPHA